MYLKDELEVLGDDDTVLGVLRAQVGMTKTPSITPAAGGGVEVQPEQLRAIFKPTELATKGRKYRWRGEVYSQPEPPFIRRRGNKDHHYTITLQRGI